MSSSSPSSASDCVASPSSSSRGRPAGAFLFRAAPAGPCGPAAAAPPPFFRAAPAAPLPRGASLAAAHALRNTQPWI
jgi:hypothetical protein